MIISQKRISVYRLIRHLALAVLASGVFVGLAMQPFTANAQVADKSEMPRVITVSGEGMAQATPDMASVMLGVVTQAKTASEAVAENTTATSAIIAVFRGAAIEARDLATSGFSVQPRYIYPKNDGNEAPRIDGYEVRNTLTVRVRDLAKLGDILDTAIKTGSNQIGGISFGVADDALLLDKARADAVEDAQRKAEIFAKAAGVKLGRVLSIEGGSFVHPQPRMFAMQARADAFVANAPVPIEAGEQEFRASVTVMWELAN